jgi:hypothetical protein
MPYMYHVVISLVSDWQTQRYGLPVALDMTPRTKSVQSVRLMDAFLGTKTFRQPLFHTFVSKVVFSFYSSFDNKECDECPMQYGLNGQKSKCVPCKNSKSCGSCQRYYKKCDFKISKCKSSISTNQPLGSWKKLSWKAFQKDVYKYQDKCGRFFTHTHTHYPYKYPESSPHHTSMLSISLVYQIFLINTFLSAHACRGEENVP